MRVAIISVKRFPPVVDERWRTQREDPVSQAVVLLNEIDCSFFGPTDRSVAVLTPSGEVMFWCLNNPSGTE